MNFLDLRIAPVGGGLASNVATYQLTEHGEYQTQPLEDFRADLRGQHVLVATHGFNVNRPDGLAHLSNWAGQLQLPEAATCIGLLWPGDSVWAHGLDYPEEPKVADAAAVLLAPFLDANLKDAASLSFVSHSLGARVVLRTVELLDMPVRRATLMAGAIDDNCLNKEFKKAGEKIEVLSVLASKKDKVLSLAFPLGNLLAGIIDEGHPWWRAALGHCGPSKPRPASLKPPYELPNGWEFEHGNYLQIDQAPAPKLDLPVEVPPQGAPPPAVDAAGNAAPGWQEAFSSAFVSTRFR